jgi:hypothetical protein
MKTRPERRVLFDSYDEDGYPIRTPDFDAMQDDAGTFHSGTTDGGVGAPRTTFWDVLLCNVPSHYTRVSQASKPVSQQAEKTSCELSVEGAGCADAIGLR